MRTSNVDWHLHDRLLDHLRLLRGQAARRQLLLHHHDLPRRGTRSRTASITRFSELRRVLYLGHGNTIIAEQ